MQEWYWKVRSTHSSGSLHGYRVTKWRQANAKGKRSSVTAMVVSGIKENNNATVGTKT
jgi:hypothetical protein